MHSSMLLVREGLQYIISPQAWTRKNTNGVWRQNSFTRTNRTTCCTSIKSAGGLPPTDYSCTHNLLCKSWNLFVSATFRHGVPAQRDKSAAVVVQLVRACTWHLRKYDVFGYRISVSATSTVKSPCPATRRALRVTATLLNILCRLVTSQTLWALIWFPWHLWWGGEPH